MFFKITLISSFTIFFVCCLFSCVNKQHVDIKEFEIDLFTKNEDNPFGSTLRPLIFSDSNNTKKNRGFNKDSVLVGYLNTIKTKDLESLYFQNKIDEDFYKNEQTKIYCLIGYKNGRQFYILDLNNNKNFDDDEIIEFDKKLKYKTEENPKVRDSFHFLNIKVFKLEKDNIYEDEAYVRFFPNSNYFSYKKEDKKQRFRNGLQLIAQFNDYYYGSFIKDEKEYKVAINKYGWSGPELMFRDIDSAFYKRSNQKYSKYKLYDTLKVEQAYYKIEEITYSPPKLKLKSILINDEIKGFRLGNKIENHTVENLEGYAYSFKDLFKSKELLLLDFWGTWCVPCKELTPSLVALNKKHNDKVSLVSLAYELDSKPVEKYVKSNNMNWFNGIIEGKPKTANPSAKLIKDLRVDCFPTFILLDKDLKIVYRTCGGGENFKELLDFIDRY